MPMQPAPRRLVTALVLAFALAAGARGAAGDELWAEPQARALWAEPQGRVLMELIGQVTNPSPTASVQYGYLTAVDGLDPAALFADEVASDATALLTFFNDSTTQRVTNVGPLRVVERIGTMAILVRDEPGATFADPSSFAVGTPVLLADFRHQVVLDTTDGSFTTVFGCVVRASATFWLDGHRLRLSSKGERFRIVVQGKSNPAGPGQFVIAGVASN